MTLPARKFLVVASQLTIIRTARLESFRQKNQILLNSRFYECGIAFCLERFYGHSARFYGFNSPAYRLANWSYKTNNEKAPPSMRPILNIWSAIADGERSLKRAIFFLTSVNIEYSFKAPDKRISAHRSANLSMRVMPKVYILGKYYLQKRPLVKGGFAESY